MSLYLLCLILKFLLLSPCAIFEHYSYALHFNEYDATSDSLHEIKWASLPYCLKELSYDNIVDWLGWVIDGKWEKKGKKIPQEWKNF